MGMATKLAAQENQKHRGEGSWSFGIGGGAVFLDKALRDFLSSGTPESRFSSATTMKSAIPTLEARLGYSLTPTLGISVNASAGWADGVRFLTPGASMIFNLNQNSHFNPFVYAGTEITRIEGGNKRVTHSVWGLHAGVGARQMLTENLALRVDGRVNYAQYNEVPMAKSHVLSPMIMAGLTYFIGGRREPPRRVEILRSVFTDTLRMGRTDTLYKNTFTTRVDTVDLASLDADQVILRVQFATDSSVLLPISYPVLDTVAAAIKSTPGSRWAIEGHTDSTGSAATNRALGLARAVTVLEYLVSKGVARSILTAEGFGPARQVFSNSTAEGRAQNRRVQLRRIPLPPTVRVP